MLTAFDNFFTKLTARVEGNYLAGLNNGGFAGLRITSRTLAFLLDGKNTEVGKLQFFVANEAFKCFIEEKIDLLPTTEAESFDSPVRFGGNADPVQTVHFKQ